jgi:hypothetical protein
MGSDPEWKRCGATAGKERLNLLPKVEVHPKVEVKSNRISNLAVTQE